jgi:hypothetical protein
MEHRRTIGGPLASVIRRGAMAAFIALALGSTAVGVHDAMHRSQDFQWSGERLLLQHIDPWAVYLNGDPNHSLIGTQIPNYLPILYLLIVPLGLLSMTYAKLLWAVANVGFAICGTLLAGRYYGLSRKEIVFLVASMLIATPTRNTIGNGQHGLLVMLLWSLSLAFPRLKESGPVVAGISYFKYSFAPPLVLLLLCRKGGLRGIRSVLFSILPCALALVLVWLWLGGAATNLAHLALEPFAVALTGFKVDHNDPNLMNVLAPLLELRFHRLAGEMEFMIALTICLAIAIFAFLRRRDQSFPWQTAVMATMSYCLFQHHPYDSVVLLFPFAYALSQWQRLEARIVLILVGYLFAIQRCLEAAHLHPQWMRYPECLMLLAILGLTYRIGAQGSSSNSVAQLSAQPRSSLQAV